MFDIGGWELATIVVVAVFVIGPDELPATLRTLGRIIRRMRSLSSAFREQVDDMIREAEMDDLRKAADTVRHGNLGRMVEDVVDPDGSLRDGLDHLGDGQPGAKASEETPSGKTTEKTEQGDEAAPPADENGKKADGEEMKP